MRANYLYKKNENKTVMRLFLLLHYAEKKFNKKKIAI